MGGVLINNRHARLVGVVYVPGDVQEKLEPMVLVILTST